MSVNKKTHAETIADIIAEMRNRAKRPDFVSQDVLKSCADRLEAAYKREIDEAERRANHAAIKNVSETLAKVGPLYDAESIGNAAKLREACANIAEYARSAMCHTTDAHVLGYLNQIEGWAKAALAAPPRNCDVLSAQEQTEKFNQFCQSHRNSDLPKCAGCPLEDTPDGTGCAQAWAQLPYESEATDGE